MSQTHEFKVAMTCEGCSGAVERILNRRKGDGVEDFKINLAEKTVQVTGTLSVDELTEIIKKSGKQTEFVKTM